jgi:hypothetical protein
MAAAKKEGRQYLRIQFWKSFPKLARGNNGAGKPRKAHAAGIDEKFL